MLMLWASCPWRTFCRWSSVHDKILGVKFAPTLSLVSYTNSSICREVRFLLTVANRRVYEAKVAGLSEPANTPCFMSRMIVHDDCYSSSRQARVINDETQKVQCVNLIRSFGDTIYPSDLLCIPAHRSVDCAATASTALKRQSNGVVRPRFQAAGSTKNKRSIPSNNRHVSAGEPVWLPARTQSACAAAKLLMLWCCCMSTTR